MCANGEKEKKYENVCAEAEESACWQTGGGATSLPSERPIGGVWMLYPQFPFVGTWIMTQLHVINVTGYYCINRSKYSLVNQ